jgi:hypothetical protein
MRLGLASLAYSCDRLCRPLITYPDYTKGWLPFGKSALEARTEKIDLMITSSLPITTQLISRAD